MMDLRLANPNRRSEYYTGFGDEEFERRWDSLRAMMDREGYDAIVVFGDGDFQHTNIRYLTDYTPSFAAYLAVFADPDKDPTLFIGLSNHLQYVREISIIDDLRLMVHDPGGKLADRLENAGISDGRIGLAGHDPRYDLGMSYQHYSVLSDRLDAAFVDATPDLLELTATKSEAELERVRRAAEVLDRGMEALAREGEPGLSEVELNSILASALSHDEGGMSTGFVSSAPMVGAEPGECLPWKGRPSHRTIERGDVVTTEISATYAGYASQIHRPYAVGEEPSATYRDMYDVAEETYRLMVDALRPGNTATDVADAVAPVEDSEYKIYDVLLHGYGNGYLSPFIGTEDSNYWPGAADPVTEHWTFEEGMVMVVQPNVVAPDEREGLQLGTTVIVTEDGPEVVHDFPVEFVRM